MNQREFDLDLRLDVDDTTGEYRNPEDGYGWPNNPIRLLFDNPKDPSERSYLYNTTTTKE